MYYYHSVTSLRTVDCLCGGVFQQRYALNAVHVEVDHLLKRRLESVENEQWLVLVALIVALDVERCLAAQLEVWHGIWVATHLKVLYNLESRVEVFQAAYEVLVAHLHKVFLRKRG